MLLIGNAVYGCPEDPVVDPVPVDEREAPFGNVQDYVVSLEPLELVDGAQDQAVFLATQL